MAFNAVCISEIGDQSNPYIYPTTDDMCNLGEEKWDNGLNNVITAKSILVQKKLKGTDNYVQVLHAMDINIDFYVTDSRVVLLCKKYDKGGGWYGGIGALVANAGSKIMAAARSKGKVLLGQVRYEWIAMLSYQRKVSWLTEESIQVYYKDNDGTYWCISLNFKKGTDTEFLANNILHRACKYRLAMNDEKGEKETEFFTKYSTGANITPNSNPKQYSDCIFPNFYFAPMGEDKRPN